MVRASLVALALLVACREEPPPKPAPAPPPVVAPAPAPADAPAAARKCDDVQADFDRAVTAATALDCATDADCGCYPGGVSPRHGCGGVVNRATVAKAEALKAEMHTVTCVISIACAAWSCQPACVAGHCTNK